MAAKPTGKPTGRPSQLTDPVRATILEAVRMGAPARHACVAAGISYSTYRDWTRHGKEDEATGKASAFAVFLADLAGARAEGLRERLKAIKKAIDKGDGWLALKFVQATHPDDFGDQRAELKAARKELADALKLITDKLTAAGG
jgi:hypothetical protein